MSPQYDPLVPAQPQDSDYDCSQESCQFMLRGWGRSPDDGWMTAQWISQGIMTPEYGLMDASGAQMASWLNATYGMDGMQASNEPSVDFNALVMLCDAQMAAYGIAAGGRTFCHWVGVRGYDLGADTLLLCNSAEGYMGIYSTLSRSDFARLGPWSAVVLLWPEDTRA